VFEVAEEAHAHAPAPPLAPIRCWPTCSTPAANTPGACAAKSTCGRPTRSPSCSTARAPTTTNTYKEYAQIINDQSRRHMTLRGLFEFKIDPAKADPAGRGRARQRDRQALRHRRHVAGLDRHRGPRHAGDRHEPHRRQEQHRRGRRGSSALSQTNCKGIPIAARASTLAERDRRRAQSRSTYRCRTATRCAARIKQVASGRFGVTGRIPGPAPTRSRSRWPRAPSRAKAVSCPAARCPSTSPSCATRCRAWA